MKRMFSLILVMLLVFVVGVMTFADDYDRENATLPTIGKPIATLKKVVKWKLNESTGQWKSSKCSNFLTAGLDDFYRLEKVPVTIDGTEYIGFVFYFRGEAYKYPNIRAGFYTYMTNIMYVLSQEQVQQLIIDSDMAEPKFIEISPICISKKESLDVKSELKNGFKKNYKFAINILPIKSKEVVRFNVLQISGSIVHAVTGEWINDGKVLLLPATFKKQYYEVSFDKFCNFFSI
jgi:hypothetical protein